MDTVLLIDGMYLCHRARYSTGGLKHQGQSTGIAFGILRDIHILEEDYLPSRVVWAFDSRKNKRKALFPEYKANRKKELNTEELAEQKDFYSQVDRLKSEILPGIGYRNIFEVEGYEGDDIIAEIARKTAVGAEAVIVTADADLWQCLADNVIWCNPGKVRKTVTAWSFMKEWKIDPASWAEVKSIAGCVTDNVPGAVGVGEKTAAKFLSDELNMQTKKGKTIIDFLLTEQLKVNRQLVYLPFDGLVLDPLVDDELTDDRRAEVEESLGVQPRSSGMRKRNKQLGFDL